MNIVQLLFIVIKSVIDDIFMRWVEAKFLLDCEGIQNFNSFRQHGLICVGICGFIKIDYVIFYLSG